MDLHLRQVHPGDAGGSRGEAGKEPAAIAVEEVMGYDLEIDYMLRCIEQGQRPTTVTVEDALTGTEGFEHRLAVIWADTLDAELERLTAKLSGLLLQTLFNLPAVGFLGYCGWLTLQTFFSGSYLSGDFFMHAFWAIGLILFLSFFLLQLCIRAAASSGRITGRAFENLKGQLDHLNALNRNPLKSQLETILNLAALAEADRR